MSDPVESWFQEHRKAIYVTAIGIAIAGTIAIIILNRKKVKIPMAELAKKSASEMPSVSNTIVESVSIEINGEIRTYSRKAFIRHLHGGWNASKAKVAEAKALSVPLKKEKHL